MGARARQVKPNPPADDPGDRPFAGREWQRLFPCFFNLMIMLKSKLIWGIWIGLMLTWQAILILRFTHWIWVA